MSKHLGGDGSLFKICFEKVRDLNWGLGTYRMNRWTFKTDATVRFGQILSAIPGYCRTLIGKLWEI